MKSFARMRSLHKDENGATMAEMVMIVGMIVVPLLIVAVWYVSARTDELTERTDKLQSQVEDLINKAK